MTIMKDPDPAELWALYRLQVMDEVQLSARDEHICMVAFMGGMATGLLTATMPESYRKMLLKACRNAASRIMVCFSGSESNSEKLH